MHYNGHQYHPYHYVDLLCSRNSSDRNESVPCRVFLSNQNLLSITRKSEFSDMLTNRKVSISGPRISDRTLDLIISCLYLHVGVSFQVLFREHRSCIEFVCDLVDFSIDPNLRLELYSRETKIDVIFHRKYTCLGCKCLCEKLTLMDNFESSSISPRVFFILA